MSEEKKPEEVQSETNGKSDLVPVVVISCPTNNPLQLIIQGSGEALDVLNVLNRAAELMRIQAVKQAAQREPRIHAPAGVIPNIRG